MSSNSCDIPSHGFTTCNLRSGDFEWVDGVILAMSNYNSLKIPHENASFTNTLRKRVIASTTLCFFNVVTVATPPARKPWYSPTFVIEATTNFCECLIWFWMAVWQRRSSGCELSPGHHFFCSLQSQTMHRGVLSSKPAAPRAHAQSWQYPLRANRIGSMPHFIWSFGHQDWQILTVHHYNT